MFVASVFHKQCYSYGFDVFAVKDVPQLQEAAALGFFDTTNPVLTSESSQSIVDPFIYPRDTVSSTTRAPDGSMNSLLRNGNSRRKRVVVVQFVVVHCEFVLKSRAASRLNRNAKMHLIERYVLSLRDLDDVLRITITKQQHLCTILRQRHSITAFRCGLLCLYASSAESRATRGKKAEGGTQRTHGGTRSRQRGKRITDKRRRKAEHGRRI